MQKQATKTWLKVCLLLCVVTLSLCLGGCGGGSTSENPFNTSGSWFFYNTTAGTAGESGPNLFTLAQSDASSNNLTGTTSQGQGITGNVSGLSISFSWVGSDSATYNYTGTISSDGFTMAGTWTNTINQSGTWHGIVDVAPLVNISGNWNITLTTAGTAGQQGPFPSTFTQAGNVISGATQGQPLIGTVSSLSIFFGAENGTATYEYTGSINSAGNTMSGTWTSTNGQSGTWSATMSS